MQLAIWMLTDRIARNDLMFKLTTEELQNAFDAIGHHGYSALLPPPAEWALVTESWGTIREELASVDLERYRPYSAMRIYAPKSRYTLRMVTLLHPQDLLMYTALVMIAKNDIETGRMARDKRSVFSYRVNPKSKARLYITRDGYNSYRKELDRRSRLTSGEWVGVADIADFYPRIYHHRLENIIHSVAAAARVTKAGTILAHFLGNVSRGDSYGIPVGPIASRILGEAILIDVDEALSGEGFKVVRWVDDFSIFCASESEARRGLFFLAEWLYEHHGLTLQPFKTKVLRAQNFRRRLLVDRDAHLTKKVEAGISEEAARTFAMLKAADPYIDRSEASIDWTPGDLKSIEALKLEEMLDEAVADPDEIDYELAAFILGRAGTLKSLPAKTKKRLVQVVLKYSDHLLPIGESMARFLLGFGGISSSAKKQTGKRLIRPLLKTPSKVPDHYAMWVLYVCANSPGWAESADLLRVFRLAKSPVVRRYAALALSQSATRAQALAVRDEFDNASPLVQLAILMCLRRLPEDERRHWKRKVVLSGLIEKAM